MNLDTISDKHLQELERLLGQVLVVLQQAKLYDDPTSESLRKLHVQAGDVRRARFDAVTEEYVGY